MGVSVGQLAFNCAISSSVSLMSTPVSESNIDDAVDAPGIGIEVGN